MSLDKITALRQALAFAADNHPLRQMLAEALLEAGQKEASLTEYAILLDANVLDAATLIQVGNLAIEASKIQLASSCLEAALKAGAVEGITALKANIDRKMTEQGFLRLLTQPISTKATDSPPAAPPNIEHEMEQEPEISFADVGGLANVKKTIHKMIILPYLRPSIFRRYGRKSGGGVLLYGPPGCGKTMLARATAGECKLPFINIRIEAILDPYIGVSERNLHRVFEQARRQAPCVVFLDEIDAIGYARRKRHSAGRALVDQLLQELDSIGSNNDALLILAATNAPWDIDDALLRPGRFDRRIFVPPPDEKARLEILRYFTKEIPSASIDYKRLANSTPLFSGADLKALVHEAVDLVIDKAIETGSEPPLTMSDLEQARNSLRPTTLEWLTRAQNYVEFANDDKRYEDVAKYLRLREVRKWRQ